MKTFPFATRARHAAALSVLLSIAACGGTTPAPEVSRTTERLPGPTPDADAFYAEPPGMPDTPGLILNSRPITFQPASMPLPNPAWQLQYVTHDGHGRPRAAVATVIQPLVPGTGAAPALLAFQHAYDSLGARCAPSHTATGDTSNSTNMAETLEYLPGLQTLGWTVVVPDYEGPDHAFGAGPISGQATLDAVRAALAFAELGLAADSPVGLWGYSGGAFASTWAAALQPVYAPELNLVGVVAGGTPVDMFDIIRRNENLGPFNFLFTLAIGIAREYPELLPPDLLTERGLAAVTALRDACVGVPADGTSLPSAAMADYVAAADPYATPGFQAVMPLMTLLGSPLQPTADVYLFHEVNDNLVPVEGADQLAAQWCAAGVPLSYYHSQAATPVGTAENDTVDVHLAGAALGTPAAIAYLQGRFAGLPLKVTPPGTVRCN